MALLVAVGDTAAIATSPDGTTWTQRTAASGTSNVMGVAYSPSLGLFVAVGYSGLMSTSPDGITWTAVPSSSFSSTTINGVAWSDGLGLFVAVANSGKLATSPDGTTWTQRTSTFSTSAITGVEWSPGLGQWVAVGSNRLATSPDGITWTSQSVPLQSWNNAAWSPALGLWAVAGASGNLITSPDGITWTARTTPFTTSDAIASVAWSPSAGVFVIVGANSKAATSPDGTTWTSRTSSFTGTDFIYDVAWSPDLSLFVATGSGKIATSPTGVTWTQRTSPVANVLHAVTSTYSVGVSASGTITAAPALSATAVLAQTRTGTITAAPALSATAFQGVTRTGTITATPALTATQTSQVVTSRTGTITAAPALSATALVTQATRTGTITAAPALSATQSVKLTRTGTITAATGLAANVAVDLPTQPPMMGELDLRLKAYAPNGASQGLLPAPDDFSLAIPLNDTPSLTLNYGVSGPRSDLLGKPLEVAVEVSGDGGLTWTEPDDCRFIYLRDGRDPMKTADTWQAEAPGLLWRLQKARVLAEGKLNGEGRREFVNTTAGDILATFWTEAQNRGALSGMTLAGNATQDASGTAWGGFPMSRTYDVGTDYLQVLLDLAAAGFVDFRMSGRTLKLYRPNTALAVDRTVGGAQVQLTPAQITESPFRRTWEGLADQVTVAGDDGSSVSVTNASALKPWGRWEDYITQGGVSDVGTLTTIGNIYQATTATERAEYTQALALGVGPSPLVDFWSGDYVWSRTLDGTLNRYRVRQVTLQKQGATVSGNVVLNDRFLEQDIQMRRWLDAISGGASAGGSGGGTPTPPGADILPPAAPAAPTVTSMTYLDSKGQTQGQVTVDWADVTTNMDGTPITDLDRYEVQMKAGGTTSTNPWQEVTRVEAGTSLATLSPYDPGTTWSFRVRAVDQHTNWSGWSPATAVVVATDNTPPPAPSQLTNGSRLGIVRAIWDGKDLNGAAMPGDLKYVEVHASTSSAFTPILGDPATVVDRLTAAGVVLKDTSSAGASTWYLRALAVDTSGNVSDPSVVTTATVQPLVDVSNFPDSAMDTLYARSGHFLDLTADNFAANKIQASWCDVGLMTAMILRGDKIETDSRATYGVKLDNANGLRAYDGVRLRSWIDPATGKLTLYDASGNETLNLNGANGAISMMGTLTSGATSGPRAILSQDVNSGATTGALTFYSDASTVAGRIHARGQYMLLYGGGALSSNPANIYLDPYTMQVTAPNGVTISTNGMGLSVDTGVYCGTGEGHFNKLFAPKQDFIKTGTKTGLACSAANTATSVDVNFGGAFDSAYAIPSVACVPVGVTNPNIQWTVGNVSRAGFTIYFVRPNTNAFDMTWTAISSL